MERRVLAIQSHVVHGYVGNKSSTFPLQLLGLHVDPINTCQFSNHTRYPSFAGDKISQEQLISLVDGLEANDILSSYTRTLLYLYM
jgi:pyridoxine kinase